MSDEISDNSNSRQKKIESMAIIGAGGMLVKIESLSPEITTITFLPPILEEDPPFPLRDFDSYVDAYLHDISDFIRDRLMAYRSTALISKSLPKNSGKIEVFAGTERIPPKPRLGTPAQANLISYLTSGNPAVLGKPTKYAKGYVVYCNGKKSDLRTVQSLVNKGVVELVPGTSGQWRLTETGRKWFL